MDSLISYQGIGLKFKKLVGNILCTLICFHLCYSTVSSIRLQSGTTRGWLSHLTRLHPKWGLTGEVIPISWPLSSNYMESHCPAGQYFQFGMLYSWPVLSISDRWTSLKLSQLLSFLVGNFLSHAFSDCQSTSAKRAIGLLAAVRWQSLKPKA